MMDIPAGKIVNIIGGKNPITDINLGQHELLYNEIAQDYAERHNAPYVHIFRDGKLVSTIARKEKIKD